MGRVKERLRCFFAAHPVLREVLWWSLPALALGLFLRLLLLSAQPLAYWGSDSKSYYSFAWQLLYSGDVSLDEKRRYLYPLLMLPVSLLPGEPLRWLAWLQHALGLATILPLAYVLRKTMWLWRVWIPLVTMAYAGMPLFLWYEHELLGEVLFFCAFLWAFGGWVAWVMEKDTGRARRLFWWFFIPLAVFLLTKPSGRFVLPGLVIGLVMVKAWHVLTLRQWIALALLAAATLTVGSKKQGAWLLYVSTFPLTQLETPLYAEYKAEIRPYAEPFIREIGTYYRVHKRGIDGSVAPFDFLESPSQENAPPLWAALDKNTAKKREVYMALAIEGIRARPGAWLGLAFDRFLASANLSGFDIERFESATQAAKLEGLYEEAAALLARGKGASLPMAFGLPKRGPMPPFREFVTRISPVPGSWAERTLLEWASRYHGVTDVVSLPQPGNQAPASAWSMRKARILPLGMWLLFAVAVGFAWWRTHAVWLVITAGYLAGMFLFSHAHVRFFAPAWLVLLPVAVLPFDAVVRAVLRKWE